MKAGDTGKLGEIAAARYLMKKGCEIICANYRTRFGEIDIIAADKLYIIFAEVKTREINSMLLPRESVDIKKQNKIIKTATLYLSQNKINLQPRFDVIEIYIHKSADFKIKEINHIKNAFTL